MRAIHNKLVLMAAALCVSPLSFGQATPPANRPVVHPTASTQDASARAEIRRLRASLESMDKAIKAMAAKPAAPPQPPALDKIATNLDALNQTLKQKGSDGGSAWLMLLVSALISGGIAYFVARLFGTGPSAAPAPHSASTNGVLDNQALKRALLQDEKTERIATLSQIRAKIDELETDARTYAGVYSLMLAYRTARNAPLQRLAEVSTREQEALLRYRSAAGHVVSLGYEYGRLPAGQIDSGLPDDLGAWLTHWWTELEGTLETDPGTESANESRNELFRRIRQKLQALMGAERESVLQEKVHATAK